MPGIEQAELENHRRQIVDDVNKLVEKYRAIFDWDVPDIDQSEADRLILKEMERALADIGRKLTRE